MAGTAITSFVDGTPTNNANPWIDSLVWGGAWRDDPNVTSNDGRVTVRYSAVHGVDPAEIIWEGSSAPWGSAALTALRNALTSWSNVANIRFVETSDPNTADFWAWQAPSAHTGADTFGYSEVPVPGTVAEPLYLVLNGENETWIPSALVRGGYAYVTLIHEIGHLIGLAHPHDGGGLGDGTLFPGVSDGDSSDFGQYGLNQGIFTTMSYMDGWQTQFPDHSYQTEWDYGYQATPMALDIAAIQSIYGAAANATGNSTYRLPDANRAGTYWSCIWDTGGTDTLTNAGSNVAAYLDLRAAPLVGANAGGYVSRANGIVGGYTIANGVVIENATGGNRADRIIGNTAANTLLGNGGADTITGGAGADRIVGGAGADRIATGTGADRIVFNAPSEMTNASTACDVITDFVRGTDRIVLTTMDASTVLADNNAFEWLGTGGFGTSARGGVRYQQINNSGSDNDFTLVFLDRDSDTQAELVLRLNGLHTLQSGDFAL